MQRLALGRAWQQEHKALVYVLRRMSGLDVLRALKADVLVKHIPVVVLSGLGQGNEAKLLKEGATAILTKSTESFESNSSALIQALQSLLTGSKV